MIKIIDYGMGNCGSIKNMLRHLGSECEVITTPGELVGATAIVLPGVGSFNHGVKHLHRFKDILNELIIVQKVPFLGVCLGMQLLLRNSDEGEELGLGWIKGNVAKFNFKEINNKKKTENSSHGLE